LISKLLPYLFALLLILPQAAHGYALPHLPAQHTRHKINIASLQDTSTYASKQASISVSGTYGYGSSATITGSQTSINGNYASVTEQSGLKAGDGGFQIKVKGNTDLKGAVIEASDAAIKDNKNTLSTATLTTSEIHNRSDYDALSVSVSAGTGGVGAPMALNASDKDESNTRSGISGAVINITDDKKQKELTGKKGEATVASLNRDVATGKDTSGAIGNNLDVAEVQASLTVTQTFVQQANTFVASMATKSEKLKAEGDAKQKQAAKETDPERQQQLQAEAKDLYQQSTDSEADSKLWQPGGTYRQIATALTAAAGGNVTSGTSQFIQGAAVNYLQSLGAEQIKALAKDIGGEGSPAHIALHGLLACGGASAQGSDCGSAAMGASVGVVINTLLAGDPSKMTATQKENRRNLVATLVAGIAAGSSANSSGIVAATNAATIETENNWLKDKSASIPALSEKARSEQANKDCSDGNKAQCGVAKELRDLSVARDRQLAMACAGGPSAECSAAARDAIINGNNVFSGPHGETYAISNTEPVIRNADPRPTGFDTDIAPSVIDAALLETGNAAFGAAVKGSVAAWSWFAGAAKATEGAVDMVGIGANSTTVKGAQWNEFLSAKYGEENVFWDWPKNNGFVYGSDEIGTLQSGQLIGRIGNEGGTFVSPLGTTPESLSLRPGTDLSNLNVYRVIDDIPNTRIGSAAPAFDMPGYGTQYELSQSVNALVKSKNLERVTK
jgi:hypothetical protein